MVVVLLVSDQQIIFTSNTNLPIFTDKPGGQRSAGAPSFIIQEEFYRYTGYWWQPKTKEGADIQTTVLCLEA